MEIQLMRRTMYDVKTGAVVQIAHSAFAVTGDEAADDKAVIDEVLSLYKVDLVRRGPVGEVLKGHADVDGRTRWANAPLHVLIAGVKKVCNIDLTFETITLVNSDDLDDILTEAETDTLEEAVNRFFTLQTEIRNLLPDYFQPSGFEGTMNVIRELGRMLEKPIKHGPGGYGTVQGSPRQGTLFPYNNPKAAIKS